MIIVKNLSLVLNNQKILDSVSAEFKKGKITTLIGNSGAGKTSLLKIIGGLYPTPKNTLFLDNQDLGTISAQNRSQKIGYVFQNFNLFAHMTVLENCIDPLLIQKKSKQEAQSIAQEKLQLLGMISFADKYPQQLSGGQQQRVAIARALCLNPEILLLDEPTASLDPINTEILVTVLQKLTEQGITVITSSQDMNFVKKIFDQIYFMQDGKIVEFCDDSNKIDASPKIASFCLDH